MIRIEHLPVLCGVYRGGAGGLLIADRFSVDSDGREVVHLLHAETDTATFPLTVAEFARREYRREAMTPSEARRAARGLPARLDIASDII